MVKHLEYDEPVLRYHEIVADVAAGLADRGAKILDLGCGPGQILGELSRRRSDLDLCGIDGDEECLARAKARAPEAELLIDDISRVDRVVSQSIDVVVSSHSLEHLPDPVGGLRRWRELLKPDGRLVLAVPNSHQPIMLGLALARQNRVNEGHFYSWDRATFNNFCHLAGFEIEQWREDYVPLVPVRWRLRLPVVSKLERLLLKLFPGFANSHIVALRPTGAESA